MRLATRVIAAILLCSISCAAQSAPPLDRLPPDTFFFFAWNGSAQLDKARATNALLRLWDDVEFAAARQLLVESAGSRRAPAERMTKAQLDLFLDVASNPFVIGMIGEPDWKAMGEKPVPGAPRKPAGFFLIYDTTGKTELHQKLGAMFAANAKVKPTLSTHTFSGVTITKEEYPRGADYNAVVGNYYISSDSKDAIEKLIPRLSGVAPAESIVNSLAYQSAAVQRAPDAFFEFFARVPDFSKIPIAPAQGMNFAAMLKGLRLDQVKAICASGSMAGNGARLRGAMLGDTTPGSLFDLFGASAGEFRTLAVAPAGSSFSANRFDFLALYQTLRKAVLAGVTAEQASQFEMIEGMTAGQIGMTVPEILQAISGELASISLPDDPSDNAPAGLLRDMYALSIQRPDDVLKLVQMVMGQNITNETREGDATVLSFTMPYRDEKTGAQRKRFHYLAVTPNMLIVAPRKVQLREAIARASSQQGPASGTLAGDPGFAQVRTRLPNQLTALSYTDLSRIPWQFVADSMIAQFNSEKQSEKLTPQQEEAIRNVPKIFTRYLKTAFGGWWKDSNGVFMESYIE